MLNPCTPKAQCFSACVSKKWCWGFDFFRPLGLMPPRLHQHWTLGARGVFRIERFYVIFRPSTVYHIINKPTSLSFGRLAPACNLFLFKMNHWDGSRCVGQVLMKSPFVLGSLAVIFFQICWLCWNHQIHFTNRRFYWSISQYCIG